MVHFFRLCYCSSGSSCTFSSLVNTKLFEMLLYEKKKPGIIQTHSQPPIISSMTITSPWHGRYSFTDPKGLYFQLTPVSLYSLCRCVSGLAQEARAHTHTDVDIHTSGKWGDSAWRGGGENAVVLLPVTNPQRGRLSRLS